MDEMLVESDCSWHLLNVDSFEGPMRWSDLVTRLQSLPAENNCRVWHPDFADWRDCAEFPELLQGINVPDQALEDEAAPSTWMSGPIFTPPDLPTPEFILPPTIEFSEPRVLLPSKPSLTKTQLALLGLFTGAIVLGGIQLWQHSRYPLPALPDLAPADYSRLEAAAKTSLHDVGPRAEAALSQIDKAHPIFRVASNLADGEEFEIALIGRPDTLVGRFQFSNKTRISLRENLAQTQALRTTGQALAAGVYRLEISNHGSVLSERDFFLGGERDSKYLLELNGYHHKLHEQAQAERVEIQEMLQTMSSQVNQIALQAKVRKADPQWTSFAGQIRATLSAWDFKRNADAFYYADLYARLPTLWSRIESLHGSHDATIKAQLLASVRIQLQDLEMNVARLNSDSTHEDSLPAR